MIHHLQSNVNLKKKVSFYQTKFYYSRTGNVKIVEIKLELTLINLDIA